MDPTYTAARVTGKNRLVSTSRIENLPILGVFRKSKEVLATSLTWIISSVFRGNGLRIEFNSETITLNKSNNGDVGDAVFLSSSVREYNGERERLPLLLRNELGSTSGVSVFNPRGRSIGQINEVSILLGLALECIDKGRRVQNGITSMSQEPIQWLVR